MTPPPQPRFAILAVLDRCDAKCVMCNIWKEHRRDEVALSYFQSLPRTLRSINITGGEPFMREDLPEVIRVINERCRRPRMIISTNGFNTKKIREKMEAIHRISPSLGVRVSVDGDEAMHDKIRGIPGGFQKCMDTVAALKELGVKDLGLSFTISPANLGDVTKVYHLTGRLGIQFTLTVAQNSEFYFKTTGNNFDLNHETLALQFNELVSHEIREWHPKRWLRAYYDKGVYDYGLGRRVLKNCSAGSSFFFSSARGEIYPCPVLNEKLGDAQNNFFEKVWNSDKARQARQTAKDCPVKCWMTCTVGPHFRQKLAPIAWWIVKNKVKAHLGYKVISPAL